MNETDAELLRRYRSERSEAAFAELIRRHLDLVYSAALRQVGNDRHAAEDVAQSVFIDLARQSARLEAHPTLGGWLYTSTRFASANHRRSEQRRRRHEESAAQMNQTLASSEPSPDWDQLRPVLDDVMHELSAEVGWNHEDAMASHDTVESHDFVWMNAKSDATGRWALDRIAADMLSRLYGSASHPEHTGSPMIHLKEDSAALEALRAGTHRFQMGRGMEVKGTVVGVDGQPIAGAEVRVGGVAIVEHGK